LLAGVVDCKTRSRERSIPIINPILYEWSERRDIGWGDKKRVKRELLHLRMPIASAGRVRIWSEGERRNGRGLGKCQCMRVIEIFGLERGEGVSLGGWGES